MKTWKSMRGMVWAWVAVSSVSALGAEPPAPGLPGGAPPASRWMVHFDVRRARESAFFRELMESGKASSQKPFAELRAWTGLDPAADLDGFTVFGRAADGGDAVAALDGRFDRAKWGTLAAANEGYEKITLDGREAYSWMRTTARGAQKVYGVFAEDGRLLLSQAPEALRKALAPGTPGNDVPLAGVLEGADAPLVAAFSGFAADAEAPAGAPRNGMMRDLESAKVMVSEENTDLVGRLELVSGSEEATQQMFAMAQGFLAMARMRAAEEMPELRPLVDSAQLHVDGRRMTLRLAAPATEVLRKIRERAQKDASGAAAKDAAGAEALVPKPE